MTANERQVGGDHYKTGGIEVWDLFGPEFLVGCAVKHVSRWRKKNGVQDLEKALHYAQKLREIAPQYVNRPHLVPLAVAGDLIRGWMHSAGMDWAERSICTHLLYCKGEADVDAAIAGIEYLIDRGSRGKTTGQVESKPYDAMTDDELVAELRVLEAAQSKATGWGAAVGLRGEYIDEIKREQRRRKLREEDTFGGLRARKEPRR